MAVYSEGDYRTNYTRGTVPLTRVSFPTNVNELLWEDKDRTLRELIFTYRLPFAVKLKTGDISKYCLYNVSLNNGISETKLSERSDTVPRLLFNGASPIRSTLGLDSAFLSPDSESKDTASGLNGEADVILQVHETRRRRVIIARKMTWETRQNDYIVSGELLEISAAVKGWLEVISEDGRPGEYFDTIGEIASIRPTRFLVRTSIVGYQLTTEENGSSCWMPLEIKLGEVLTTGIVVPDSKRTKYNAHRNILRRLLKPNKAKKEQDLTYLQSFDSSDREIMIPLTMSGVFSPVGNSTVANPDAVYELQDLIMAFGLPVDAQIIHSNDKDSFNCPRGVIRLYGTREEELAIVSKVGPDGVLFCEKSNSEKFEIPVDNILFNRGVVKQKPVTQSKLPEACPFPYNKVANKEKIEYYEIKDKDYVMTQSMDNIRQRTTYDQRLSTSYNENKSSKPARCMSNYAPLYVENSDANVSKLRQQNTQATTDTLTQYNKTLSCESKTPVSLVSGGSKQQDSSLLYCSEQNTKTDVELPKRVPKETKKSRSTSILDKLSVRIVKKERAKLKEMRRDDVFSKRISRCELSYQEFFTGIDNDAENSKNSGVEKLQHNDSGRGSSGETYQSSSSSNSSGGHSTSTPNIISKSITKGFSDTVKSAQRRNCIQARDLPPIPPGAQSRANSISPNQNASNDSLYEHLPPAPQSPHFRRASDSALLGDRPEDRVDDDEDSNEDGYMVPLQVHQEQRYIKRSDAQLLNKPPGMVNDSLRSARVKKTRNELPPEFSPKSCGYSDRRPVHTEDFFNLAFTCTKYGENHPLCSIVGPHAASTSQLYSPTNAASVSSKLTRSMSNFDQRVKDSLDLSARDTRYALSHNARPTPSGHADSASVLNSHGYRKGLTNENSPLNYTDSFRDINEGRSLPAFPGFQNSYMQNAFDQQSTYIQNSRPRLFSSRSVHAEIIPPQLSQNGQYPGFYGRGYRLHYSGSDPSFHQLKRPSTHIGIGDASIKRSDDSAISMCSRGEAGFLAESDYSCKEYRELYDSEWVPPEQLGGLSVREVSKSLRYIGMKDRIVLRFSNEQIDGSMLCTLDKKLLNEGFPELNALEVKKILDFVQGWRPKKS